jgi:Ran GTPase-activating protein (RanGAP) involved in mRNA processing and transport
MTLAQGVAKALETNSTLKTLELGYNPIGPDGAKALATAIKFHGAIDTLRLGWCKVEKEGTAHLADALRCALPRACWVTLRARWVDAKSLLG